MKFNIHSKALFLNNGMWVETKTTFSSSVVPSEIKKAIIEEGYQNWNIEQVTTLETFDDSAQFIIQVFSRKEYYENYKHIDKIRERTLF